LIIGRCSFGRGFWSFAFYRRWRVRRRKRSWVCGLGTGLLPLIFVEAPAYITRYGLANDDAAMVRNWGSQELLGDMAREGTWGFTTKDTSGLMMDLTGGPHRLLEQRQSSVPLSAAGRPGSPDDLAKELIRAVEGNGRKYRDTTLPEGAELEGKKG